MMQLAMIDFLMKQIAGVGVGLCLAYLIWRVFDHYWERVDGTEGRQVADLGNMRFGPDRQGERLGSSLDGAFLREGRNTIAVTEVEGCYRLCWRNHDQEVASIDVRHEDEARSWFDWAVRHVESGGLRATVRDGRPTELDRKAVPLIGRDIVLSRDSVGRLQLESTSGRRVWLRILVVSPGEGRVLAEHLRSGSFAAPAAPPPRPKRALVVSDDDGLQSLVDYEKSRSSREPGREERTRRERLELAERLLADPER